jgi:hypothetical protein
VATSRSLQQLAKRFAFIAKKVEENSLKNVKRAAIAADQALVFNTPVDTGRAASNWLASIGTPRGGTVDEPSSPGAGKAQALEQGRSTIASYKLDGGGIYLTNNLPYIVRLDQGYSRKRPAGMTEAALAAARRQFSEAKLLEGI